MRGPSFWKNLEFSACSPSCRSAVIVTYGYWPRHWTRKIGIPVAGLGGDLKARQSLPSWRVALTIAFGVRLKQNALSASGNIESLSL